MLEENRLEVKGRMQEGRKDGVKQKRVRGDVSMVMAGTHVLLSGSIIMLQLI